MSSGRLGVSYKGIGIGSVNVKSSNRLTPDDIPMNELFGILTDKSLYSKADSIVSKYTKIKFEYRENDRNSVGWFSADNISFGLFMSDYTKYTGLLGMLNSLEPKNLEKMVVVAHNSPVIPVGGSAKDGNKILGKSILDLKNGEITRV